MSGSSLSSVVSDLVRASMGSSVPSTVTDADLDRHIGEIILREAKQKAERYKKDGIRAYLPTTDPNVPRANKRFLSSIIKSTDDHNKAVSHLQAVAAAESKEEREEQERRERRARADEAAQDRLRMLMSGGRRRNEDRWRPGRERERHHRKSERARDDSIQRNLPREVSRPRSRDWERHWDDDPKEDRSRIESSHRRHRNNDHHRHHRRRSSSRSRSPGRDRERSKQHPRSRSRTRARADNVSHRSHRRRQYHSSSPSRSPHGVTHALKRSRSPTLSTPSNNDSRSTHGASPSHSRSPRRSTRKQTSPINIRLKSPSPISDVALSPSPPLASLSRTPSPRPISSKMDKYFSPTYDPRLDVAPLVSSSSGLTVDVPSTGLVDNAQFEGWDAMLELIRIRREDRAEKKRLERLGLLPEKDKDGRGKKGKGMVSAGAEDGKGIMEIAYQKKGAVREWDMGKEGF